MGNNSDNVDVVLDRDELPPRFRRMRLTTEEIEAIDVRFYADLQTNIQSGGATLVW